MTVTRNELDKRIKDFSDIQSYIQYDDKYVGETGYFGNRIIDFKNLNRCKKSVLVAIDDDTVTDNLFDNGDGFYRFFLPESLVLKEKKTKKYRPYSVMEFIKYYPIGSYLHLRIKDDSMEMHRLIDGYNDYKNGNGTLFMCGTGFSMSELYENYEIFKDGEWKPFGVEE